MKEAIKTTCSHMSCGRPFFLFQTDIGKEIRCPSCNKPWRGNLTASSFEDKKR
jgi:hypothetical protein